MKGILYYFSGTGNTKWVADRFKKEFELHNVSLDLVSIENCDLKLKSYDFLILGTPIYAEMPPKLVNDFIRKIPKSDRNINCIIYSTQGGKVASGIKLISRDLNKKGYNVLVEAMIQMVNNYYFAIGKQPNELEIQSILQKANNKINQIVSLFMNKKNLKDSVSIITVGAGIICSKIWGKVLPRMSRNLMATDECVKCGLCLRNCPKENITFENGKAVFHSKCMLCLRCIYVCPVNAIRYKGKKINQIQKERINLLQLK